MKFFDALGRTLRSALLSLFVFTFFHSLQAQTTPDIPDTLNTDNSGTPLSSFSGQIPVWEDDFSDPSKWVVYNESAPPVDWTIETALNISPVPDLNPILLPTGTNGFAFINGDAQGEGSIQNSWIEYVDPIDFSDFQNASLTFQQVSRNFATNYFVEFSVDGGLNWVAFQVNEDLLVNTNTSNPEGESVDVSELIDGESEVRLRFNYVADWGWFWAIDDIVLFGENQCNTDIDLGPDIVACSDDEVVLDAGPGFDFYEWSNGETSQTITVNSSGTYDVTAGFTDCGFVPNLFYSEDFSNGFAGKGENGAWSFEGDQGNLWFISYPSGSPDGYDPQSPLTTTNAYGGFIPIFGNTITTIPSTTAENGFVMLDSDRYNSTATTPADQISSNFTTNEIDAILVSPSIDLSGVDSASLFFWQQWRMCCSNYDLTVEFSTNEGESWFTYNIFDLSNGQGNATRTEEFSIDISDVLQSASDLSDCRIRFIWDRAVSLLGESSLATHYYFMLDDVRIAAEDSNTEVSGSDEINVEFLEVEIAEADTSILAGQEVELTALVNGMEVEEGEEPILWSTGEEGGSIVVAPFETTTYILSLTKEGVTCSDSVTISVCDTVSFDLGPDTLANCGVQQYTLDAGPGFDGYFWSTGETTQSIVVEETGTYSVTVGLVTCQDSSSNVFQTYWSEDFSNGFDGQDDNGAWSFDGEQGEYWFITFPLGEENGYDPNAPLTTTDAYGDLLPNFNTFISTIPSPSAENGFAMLDTDRYNSTRTNPGDSPGGNFLTEFAVEAGLESPPIDLTGVQEAELTFWQAYRICCSDGDISVEISTNGGNDWTIINLFELSGAGPNDEVAEEVSIDISSILQAADDLSDCRVRFSWDPFDPNDVGNPPTHYYAMFDDVRITSISQDFAFTTSDSVFVNILEVDIDTENTSITAGEEVVLNALVNGSADISSLAPTIEFTNLLGTYDGRAYYEGQIFQSWEEANDFATTQGAYLATITNQDENEFINGVLQSGFPPEYYLGLSQNFDSPDYSEPDGGWEWVTGETFDYANWAPSEPNNLGFDEHVAVFNKDLGQWVDRNGVFGRYALFEKDLLTYTWSTGDTTASISVSPDQTTVYTVTVSDGILSCTASVTIEVGCDVIGGTLTADFDEETFCLGNGPSNFIQAEVAGNQGLGQFGIAKAATFEIVGGNETGFFNLNNFPPGDYVIGYVSYTDPFFLAGVDNVGEFNGCFDISNLISFSTYFVDGGQVSADVSTVVCVGDEEPSSLSFSVEGESGPNFRWAILNEEMTDVLKGNVTGNFYMENFEPGTYKLVHAAYGEGINIQEVDPQMLEGCIDVSNVLTLLVLDCSPALLEVSPNPASDLSFVTFKIGESGSTRLELFDLSGRLVESVYSGVAEGDVEYRMKTDVRNQPDGVYLYRLTSPRGVVQEKLVISR